MLAPGT